MDASGALYGTTYYGGNTGAGLVFKLVGHKETILHSFCGGNCNDGANPIAGLIMDANGTLYGTTPGGGRDVNCDYPSPCGVVFKLVGKKETVLHNFRGSFITGAHDGAYPEASLTMDSAGNLYGTTVSGGKSYGSGTVFEIPQGGKETVLYRFPRGYYKHPFQHGLYPTTRVIRDAAGNLYGTTSVGGDQGAGVVFEISQDGTEKVLHSFCSGDCWDGAYPYGDLIMDAQGNLYGTAAAGGANGNGTIYKITLHSPNAP